MRTVYLCVLIYRSQRNIKRLMWGNFLQLPPLVRKRLFAFTVLCVNPVLSLRPNKWGSAGRQINVRAVGQSVGNLKITVNVVVSANMGNPFALCRDIGRQRLAKHRERLPLRCSHRWVVCPLRCKIKLSVCASLCAQSRNGERKEYEKQD